MPKHSTGALSLEQHAQQDKIYAEQHEYDYLIIGSGLSALTVGALLVNAGHKICMLEAHDIPGGYAHSFKMGDYTFCAQIHYVWGCGPGDTVNNFLKKIGLDEELTFVPYDADGYDHMVMPDGKRVKIPFGFDRLADNIDEAYPGSRESVEKFLKIIDIIRTEERKFPSSTDIRFTQVLTMAWKFRYLIKYRNKTLQNVFDECGLSQEAQAVLCAQAGDFMSPPEELSVLAYAGLFGGYNAGAYYPEKHMNYYVNRLAKFITDHDGSHIFYETAASKINVKDNMISSVETENGPAPSDHGQVEGKTFKAKNFICNADPQHTAKNLIGWDKFPKKFQKALSYSYSSSGVIVYLGLKDIDLKKHGFGSFNIWHLEQWNMNQIWKEQGEGNFKKPWVFISTATLHSNEGGVAPEGSHVMEIETYADFQSLRDLKDKDPKLYRKKKMEIADIMIDLVEEKYLPGLREHIAIKVVGSPTTNEDYVRAPRGNAYGPTLTTKQMGLGRVKADTPWPNFFWCNATSGYGGFHGATGTGMGLYSKLTGDPVFDSAKVPEDAELIKYAREKWEEHKK